MSPSLKLLRPKQWIKNGFVFAPLFFAHQFLFAPAWIATLLAALCFICISSMVYVANDIRDVEEDRRHPTKKNRPLAAGQLSLTRAKTLGVILAAPALLILMRLPLACTYVALVYLGANIAYTLWLKRIAIVDIFFIASCYVLRVLMGCYALQVIISPWIILTTFLLALFLGFGKRYHEMGFEDYARTKPNLQHYSRDLLDRLVTITAGAALMTYAIYAAEVAKQINRVEFVYTTAFVAFGLFRYLQSVYVYKLGGEPETIILKDKLQLANIGVWLGVTLWILF